MNSTAQPPKLSTAARWVSGLLGVALIVASATSVYFPPGPSTVERDAKDVQIKRTSTPTDLSSAFITLALSGVGLLLFGLNGYRFTKFSAGGVSADSESVAEEAKKQISTETEDTPKIAIDKTSEPDPRPTQAPVTTVDAQDEAYAIYTLANVPSQVIQDALANWPTDHSKPGTLADFEYASRKKGKGNHAWQLKFRGTPPLVVTYGGFAKGDATVKPA